MKSHREVFSKVKFDLDLPDLLEIQKKSFSGFLQKDVPPDKREMKGLQKLFKTFFPVRNSDVGVDVEFVSYDVGDPEHSPDECLKRNLTYSVPIRVTFRIINRKTGEIIEKPNVYIGDIPFMTDRATFIVNGIERVVVNQIIKSSGIMFSAKKGDLSCKIVPEKGIWLEFGIVTRKELMYFSLDNKKKMLITYFLRSIGFTTQDIIKSFFNPLEVNVDDISPDVTKDFYLYDNICDDYGNVIFWAFTRVTRSSKQLKEVSVEMSNFKDILKKLGIKSIKVIDEKSRRQNLPLFNSLRRERELADIEYSKEYGQEKISGEDFLNLRGVQKVIQFIRNFSLSITSFDLVIKEIQKQFYDPKFFDLGDVGRYKLMIRLYKDATEEEKRKLANITTLTQEDIVRAIKTLMNIFYSNELIDDVDHLSNRRVRSVGEILYNELFPVFEKMQRIIEDKIGDEEKPDAPLHYIIMMKPFGATLSEFFGTSQLSHFMDQINPLSELTNKRRVSALGPGGLTKERAGFEVRDIHYTHYGRLCPIETPEGQNIGLILSLATYARVNEFGFIQTPYRVVENGKVTDKVIYVTAIEEEDYYICQSTEPLDDENRLVNNFVDVRYKGKFLKVAREKVQLMDVSPKQVFSVSTSLIPFLEHDDANRALMGSNMQRQAVPLLKPQAPIVGTGMEEVVAKQAGYGLLAKKSGVVKKVDSRFVVVENDDGTTSTYSLFKFKPTNNNTCYNQRPIVSVGQRVEVGEIIADGPSMDNGELALGANVVIAYMPWYGYNYEDAIVISDRLVREDILTSIHIYEYEAAVRDTKFGPEELTRDIPNTNEYLLRNLDENGIARIGSYVKSDDIIVGKVMPRGEEVESPEYKLLRVIFGEKARTTKDSSLRVPHGEGGIVIDVQIFSRDNGDDLPMGVNQLVKVYVAQKRKIKVGDKLSGRHGNKGVIARIAPEEDMPLLPDGRHVDIVFNPLGVPSRMNLGQLFETMLGWAGIKLGVKYKVPVFEGPSYDEVKEIMKKAGLPETSKIRLRDGRTGEFFDGEVMVGVHYVMKLVHMVEDKIHARSIGPYALITQQPLGGKAQFGGQRLGEMEVWALEAYGASTLLHEMLTVKSDDIGGRVEAYDGITKGKYTALHNVPESFKVLVNEMRGLLLDIEIFDRNGNPLYIFPKDKNVAAARLSRRKKS